MKLHLALISTTALAATATAVALAAGPSSSIGGAAYGSGVLIGASSTKVDLSRTSGFFMGSAIVPPGATFGWHSHRTPVVVAVTAGTLTLYDSSGPKCTPHRYAAGQGFIEPANHIHLARNEGKTRVVLYGTYVGVSPHLRANPALLDVFNEPRPRKCPRQRPVTSSPLSGPPIDRLQSRLGRALGLRAEVRPTGQLEHTRARLLVAGRES